MSDVERLQQFIIVKLTLLVDATRMPWVTKKDVEAALERAIADVEAWKA